MAWKFKPGDQFAMLATEPITLPLGGDWKARCWLRTAQTKKKLGEITVTLAETVDHATTGNYSMLLFAESTQTVEWIADLCGETEIEGDVLFFDDNNPTDITHTQTFVVPIQERITE